MFDKTLGFIRLLSLWCGNRKAGLEISHTKLKELVLYICDQCQGHDKFGMVKLNKILFYSDFGAYSRLGKSITGATYFRNKQGPTPRNLALQIKGMRLLGQLNVIQEKVFKKIRQRPIAKQEYNSSLFTEPEIAIVNEVIEALKDKTADEVSKLSHTFIGYQLVELNEDIPYFTVFCQAQGPQKLSKKTIERARQIDAQYNQ